MKDVSSVFVVAMKNIANSPPTLTLASRRYEEVVESKRGSIRELVMQEIVKAITHHPLRC